MLWHMYVWQICGRDFAKMADICEVEFAYSYVVREEAKQLVLPIKIPFDGKINELVARVIKQHDIPCYFENELTEQLTSFIREETSKWRDKISDDTILYAFEEKVLFSIANYFH